MGEGEGAAMESELALSAEEMKVIYELRAIAQTVHNISTHLDGLVHLTSPQGELYQAQQEALASLTAWDRLFKAAEQPEQGPANELNAAFEAEARNKAGVK